MDLRELKIQFLHAKIVTDDIKVMFRTPNCSAYYNCNCHIIKYKGDNVLIIDLIDKIKPTFKVGDKVTNISGLFHEVGYTIKEVNEEEQYYSYKEINGKTYFKDQDKLVLVSNIIIPKFKKGDIVINTKELDPKSKLTIYDVDYNKQCYLFENASIVINFKDQDKLMLVEIKPKFKVGDKVKGASSEDPEKVFTINAVNINNKCYHYFNGKGIITMFKDQDKLVLVESDNSKPP